MRPNGTPLGKSRFISGDCARLRKRRPATRAPQSLAYIKHTVHTGLQMDMTSALDYESFLVSTIYETKDRREGIGAFLEKRKAKFTGE